MTAFIPYATMLKLKLLPKLLDPKELPVKHLECVNCRWECELECLYHGDVDENCCPSCKMTAGEYWKGEGRFHREVPNSG